MRADPTVYKSIVSVQSIPSVSTPSLFRNPTTAALSPIDRFISNTTAINILYVPYNDPSLTWHPELGTLVVLGYMSAIESYLRALVSGLIHLDDITRALVGSKNVSFAAATHYGDGWLLSEALLEHISFATSGEIEKVLNQYVGLKDFPADVKAALTEFKKLCELRHCCVHRFGKLGSQNALQLGFDEHRDLIERPFSPSVAEVETIADALQIIVKTLNNFVFGAILDRTVLAGFKPGASWQWTWNYPRDRKRFSSYYDLFAIKNGAQPSPEPKIIYGSLRQQHSAMIAARLRAPSVVPASASH